MLVAHDGRHRDGESAVLELYASGSLTIGETAKLAGRSRFEMREIICESDVELRLGPETMEEASREIEVALDVE